MTSVKTSADLNLKRASTRVHAPPGGSTSIDLGGAGYERPKPLVQVVEPVVVLPPAPTAAEEAAAIAASTVTIQRTAVASKDHQVGIVIVEGPGSDEFISETKASFAAVGINNLLFMPVADAALLTFAAQNLVAVCDVVVAGAILLNDAIGSNSGALSQTLAGGLTQLGLISATCVIPAIVSQDSLLEAKALLPDLSRSWARSSKAALDVKAGKLCVQAVNTASPKPPVVVSEVVTSVEDLLTAFQQSLKARGASGICGLSRKFRIADDDNSGDISWAEFQKLISEHTLGWTPAQTKTMFDYFDKDKSGSIVFDEFLVGIRGRLNDRRRQLVLMAFEIMDADKSGIIELNDIQAKYDASKHPDVIARKRTADEVLREFLDTFDSGVKDGKITPTEFCEYYSNVSSSIDNDDYFELMIRNAWHISGGEGWCANTSCRRVLVTHADGRQTVEEIKNDLGIKADDKAAMIANLASQGITDVVSIDTKGSADNTTPAAAAKPAAVDNSNKPAAGAAITAKPHKRTKGGESTIVLG